MSKVVVDDHTTTSSAKTNHDSTVNVQGVVGVNAGEDGTPRVVYKVYKQRYAVLLSFMLTYFMAQWYGNRVIILNQTFAHYYNTTSNFSPEEGEVGIDFMIIYGNFLNLVGYPVAAYVVDRIGLKAMIVSSLATCLQGWIWYAAGTNYGLVIFARTLGSFLGTWNTTSILALSNRFFPETERARATAAGTVFGLLGAGVAQIVGPFFHTFPHSIIDRGLKSCDWDSVDDDAMAQYEKELAETKDDPDKAPECAGDLESFNENFCCYQPADIDQYNLVQACVMTVVALYALIAVRDRPPTPPSSAAMEKVGSNFRNVPKLLLTNRRLMQMSFVDLLVTGPPTVLFSAITRILPGSVRNLAFAMAAAGVGVAIPSAALFSWYLDKKRMFYTFTAAGYCTACIAWMLAAVGYESGTLAGGYTILVMGGVAIIAYLIWGVSEYELKLEWGFSSLNDVEGSVTALDRWVINLSSMIWIAAIPPERVTVSGTYWIGFAVLIIGTFVFLIIPNKFSYERMNYEKSYNEKVGRRSSALHFGAIEE